MIKAILFDLDGTLLPQDQDKFTAEYFKLLAIHHAKCGLDGKLTVDSVWKGTYAMLKNIGEDTNENVFWRVFEEAFGKSKAEVKPMFDDFYAHDFDELKKLCGFTESAGAAVAAAKECGAKVALATNPIFPVEAQIKRAEWAGVNACDFALVTSYENSRFCKPRTEYYIDIANALGVKPEECVMIGNDTSDDLSAAKIGMTVFLVTDCLINKSNIDIAVFPHGNMDKLVEFIQFGIQN